MPGQDPRKAGPKAGTPMTREERKNLPKKSKVIVIEMGKDGPITKGKTMLEDIMGNVEFKAKGGRAGYKMGSKCKLATKGKGRAYGKNS
jgi:hypothetical protein